MRDGWWVPTPARGIFQPFFGNTVSLCVSAWWVTQLCHKDHTNINTSREISGWALFWCDPFYWVLGTPSCFAWYPWQGHRQVPDSWQGASEWSGRNQENAGRQFSTCCFSVSLSCLATKKQFGNQRQGRPCHGVPKLVRSWEIALCTWRAPLSLSTEQKPSKSTWPHAVLSSSFASCAWHWTKFRPLASR